MAYTRFTNLTPLTVKIRIAGTDNVLAVLKPCDEASAKTPRGVEFEVTDDSDCVVVARGRPVKNETQSVQITDDGLRSKVRQAATVAAKLVNTLPYAVAIHKVYKAGQEARTDQIGAGQERDWGGAEAGVAFGHGRIPRERSWTSSFPRPPGPRERSRPSASRTGTRCCEGWGRMSHRSGSAVTTSSRRICRPPTPRTPSTSATVTRPSGHGN